MSGIGSISSSMMSSINPQSLKRPDPAEMFKKIDTDADGAVNQSEIDAMAKDMVSRTGKTLDTSEAITTYDTNGDALLSQDEMGTMMMALRETMGPPPQGAGPSPEQAAAAYQAHSDEDDSEAMLNSLDTNGDGVISQEELEAMFDKLSVQTGTVLDSEQAISTYDEDEDGALSQDEMAAMASEIQDALGPPPPPPGATGPSAEQVAAAYQATSDRADTLAVLLDLMDQYRETAKTDAGDDTLAEVL